MPSPMGACVQPLQHVQPLTQAAVPAPRREPGAGFVVAFVVVEHQETLHAPMRRRQPAQIAHTIRFGRVRLRDAAAQYHARALAQMRQGRVQRGAADVVEIEIHPLRAGAGDGGGQILLRLVIDRRVGAELARDEGAFLRPARDSRHTAAFDAGDLHRDLTHAAGGG